MTTPYVDPQTLHNPATGTSPPASWGDSVRDGLQFLAYPPGCQVNRTSALELTTGVWRTIPFGGTEGRDTDAFHDTSTDTENIVIPTGLGGWYQINVYCDFEANATGSRGIRVQLDGVTTIGAAYMQGVSSFNTRFTLTDELELAADAVITVDAYQNSGGALDLEGARATVRLVALS